MVLIYRGDEKNDCIAARSISQRRLSHVRCYFRLQYSPFLKAFIGMRWTRSHDRAMVVFIFCSCCMSLNVLFSKIRRILEIKELERTSEREAEIVSLIYYNSSVAGGASSLYLLIQSEDGVFPDGALCESRNGSSHNKNNLRTVALGSSNVLIGICETAAEPFEISVRLDDFNVAVSSGNSF
ncbi:hypothetical protein RB195_000744 [Necator americanus]|uniref:Uncharacterized protein n=1 Tax=Necator americanus TaxID=51031 RepID=A0ABR1DB49_NECAM